MDNSTQNGASVPVKDDNSPLSSIKSINPSLPDHRVEAQDLDNWLIYHDDNGQLIGWITATKLKTFEACLLRTDHANNFQIHRGLDSYQKALDFVLRAY